MRRSSRDAVEEFEELRRLLVGRERRELEELREQIVDKERRARDIAAVLPAAIRMSGENGGELSAALRPAVEASVQESIEQRPETLVDALHPIVGALVRRSLAERMRRFLQSLGRTRAWLLIILAAAFFTAAVATLALQQRQWSRFVRQLQSYPGIVVTRAEHHWFGKSEVAGLRDVAATDPAAITRAAGLDPAKIDFAWKSYLALDDTSVLQRFQQRFGVPPGVQISLHDGVLTLAGTPPYEWLDQVRHAATLMAGISSISDSNARVSYNRDLAQERFEARFHPPDGIYARVGSGVLLLSGEASHRWLERVRAEATQLPGIKSVDTSGAVDIDERAFNQSKSIIERAPVYFLANKENIASEGFAALSRLPDELRRCDSSARRIGVEVSIEIDGYVDAVGEDPSNAGLSLRRAEKVRDFLVSCGFDVSLFDAQGKGRRPVPPGAPPAAAESDRRVELKVISHPIVTER